MGRLPKIRLPKAKRSFTDIRSRFEERISLATQPKDGNSTEEVSNIDEGSKGIKFVDKTSSFVKRVTIGTIVAVAAICTILSLTSSGTYLSAWFLSFALSIILLVVMSIPRFIRVSHKNIELHCLLELTIIPLRDIRRVHRIERYRARKLLPILGIYGFGGFYGYYFDSIHFRIVRISAKKLSGMVVIQDIYNNRYYVSTQNPDLFVATVHNQISLLKQEDVVLDKESGDDDDNDFDEQ